MNRRAASALRFLAVVYILSTVKSIVFGVIRDSLLSKVTASSYETYDLDALILRLHTINTIGTYIHFAIAALTIIGLVLLAMALERHRGLVTVAVVLVLAYVTYEIYEQLSPPTDVRTAHMLVWLVTSTIYGAARMLPMIAASRELPRWSKAGLATAGAIVLVLIPAGIDLLLINAKSYSVGWQWVYRVVELAYTGWFVAFALMAARVLQDGAPADVGPQPGIGLDASPLRTIGWAIFVRVGAGFVLAVWSIFGAMHGSYDGLANAAVAGTVIGVITSLFMIGGLAGYAKYPAAQRGDGLYVLIGLLVVGVILDIICAKTSISLYGLADSAQHASSMWSMPSMSDMESMQETMVWTGRLSLVMGLVSLLVLLGSLSTTARSVDAPDLARLSGVTMALVGICTFGAIIVGAWMQTVKHKDEDTLLVLAIVLFIVAILALTNLLRVVFGVASAVERPAIPGADPLPKATVVER